MQDTLIAFYLTVSLSLYNFIKLLSYKLPRRNIYKALLYAYILFMPLILYIVKLHIPYLHVPVLIISMICIFKYIYRRNLLIIINTTLFSIGILYCILMISNAITAFIIFPLFSKILDDVFILKITSSIIRIIIHIYIFRLNRLKNGVAFLKTEQKATLGTIFSIAIIILTMFLSNSPAGYIYIVPVVSLFLLIILFYSWNKLKFQQYYNNMNATREFDFLKHEISILNMENERLSKLIHKDNKLIPALEMSVRNFINSDGDKIVGEHLILELQTLTAERKEALFKSSSSVVYNTGLIATDSLLNYFKAKTAESNIEFSCIVSGNITETIGDTISVSDFNSILADLIENALIATEYNNGHHIHVVIIADKPIIEVYDSGTQFDLKVLANLGLKRYTTHKGTGTGIGLTSIFEFTSKYNASLTIDETKQTDPRFTKKVSISFNSGKEYKLITSRTKEDIKYLYRREDIIIEQPV